MLARRRTVARPLARLVPVLTTAALVGATLAATAPAASAADPEVVSGGDVRLTDLPTYPAQLVAADGRLNYLAQSALGTTAQEYGATGTPTPEVQKAWADAEEYGHPGSPGGAVQRLDEAVDLATGDVDGDGSVDAVYLVPPAPGAATATLVVLGSQHDGFPLLDTVDVPAGSSHVEVLTRTQTVGGEERPTVVVATGEQYVDLPGSANDVLPLRFFGMTAGELTTLTSFGSLNWAELDSVLDTSHRAPWDRYVAEEDTPEPSVFEVLSYDRDNWDLVLSRYVLEGDATSVSPALRESATVVTGLMNPGPGVEITDARLASDVDATLGTDGQEVAVSVVLPQTFTEPARREVWRVSYAEDGGPLPGLGVQADELGICAQQPESTADIQAPLVDVEVVDGTTVIQCVDVVDAASDTVRVGTWIESVVESTETLTVPGATDLRAVSTRIVIPCLWLLEGQVGRATAVNGSTQPLCSAGYLNLPGTFGLPWSVGVDRGTRIAAAVTLVADEVPTYLTRTSAPGSLSPSTPITTVTTASASGASTSASVLTARLPHQRNRVTMTVPAGSREVIQTRPIPVAFLAAPPQVAGAGQESDAPVFAQTTSSGSSSTTSTATTLGASFGVNWEDPTGAFGIEASVSFENEAEQGYTASRTITQSESYQGMTTDDSVVYRTSRFERYTGQVVESSTGVALGTTATVDLPMAATQSVASLTYLRKNFPQQFGPGGTLTDAIATVFGHQVGDPGSYLSYGASGGPVSDYCDGTLDPGGDRELRAFDPLVPATPFTSGKPADPPQPDILVSDLHQVLIGTGNGEGASFGIESGQENSRVVSNTLAVDASFTAGYISAGVSASTTWSRGWSQSLSSGVEFDSLVGHIPGSGDFLDDEAYDWRSFLCQKTVTDSTGVPITAWVLNYTVDDYHGSGGLEPLSPIVTDSPLESETTADLLPGLTWSQETGTVRRYDWKVEAVGRNDVHSGSITFASPSESNAERETSYTVTPDRELLPGQLYRWRATATDFFGNVVEGEYEFFTTPGVPVASFAPSSLTPAAGEPVLLTNTSLGATSYSWDFGDGTTSTQPDPVKVFTRPGSFDVTLTATSQYGESSTTRTLVVATSAADDAYAVAEDAVLTVPGSSGVLANDAGATVATLASPPAHGVVDLRADGGFTYTPEGDVCGTDSFAYLAGPPPVAAASVQIAVGCAPDAPTVAATAYTVAEDSVLSVAAPGVLASAADADGDALTASLAAGAAHGTVVVRADGGLDYTPRADYCGPDSFRVRVSDGSSSSTAQVSVTVSCRPDAPVARDDSTRTREDVAVTVDVLANDTDADGTSLSVRIASAPARGSAVVRDGRVVYTPARNLCGTDRFAYTVRDPSGRTDRGEVAVRVTCVNDAPIARADRYDRRGTARLVTTARTGVLANDRDPERTRIVARLFRAPLYGRVVLRADGSFVYTPRPGARVDSFVYRAYDGRKYSAPVRVVITRR